jgi:hypothetical protein
MKAFLFALKNLLPKLLIDRSRLARRSPRCRSRTASLFQYDILLRAQELVAGQKTS